MKLRPFGNTGLAVSEISLGTVELGLDYGIGPDARRPAFEDAERILNRALDLGINFIDTARAYGEAEAVIGRALARRRREFILCTKVLPTGDTRASVETSLRLLATDAIDIVMIHCRADQPAAPPEVCDALLQLRKAGLIRFLGASVYGEAQALEAIAAGFDCLQVAHSVLDRRPEERVLPEAAAKGVGIVTRSVLLKGVLSRRAASLHPSLAPLAAAAQALGRPLEELPEFAYRYLLGMTPPHTLLVGASNIEELEAAVRFAALGPLPAGDVTRLRAQPVLGDEFLNPGRWPATAAAS